MRTRTLVIFGRGNIHVLFKEGWGRGTAHAVPAAVESPQQPLRLRSSELVPFLPLSLLLSSISQPKLDIPPRFHPSQAWSGGVRGCAVVLVWRLPAFWARLRPSLNCGKFFFSSFVYHVLLLHFVGATFWKECTEKSIHLIRGSGNVIRQIKCCFRFVRMIVNSVIYSLMFEIWMVWICILLK